MPETFKFSFDGKLASEGVLDIYDAARWLYGSARVFQIIAPYYATGKIISQAPRSSIQVTIIPPRRGTFIEEIAVAVLGGIMSASFAIFAQRLFDRWFPPENHQMKKIHDELRETNRLLREASGKAAPQIPDTAGGTIVDQYIEEHNPEIQVLRSITASSFKDVF